jgi:hypothetical protein
VRRGEAELTSRCGSIDRMQWRQRAPGKARAGRCQRSSVLRSSNGTRFAGNPEGAQKCAGSGPSVVRARHHWWSVANHRHCAHQASTVQCSDHKSGAKRSQLACGPSQTPDVTRRLRPRRRALKSAGSDGRNQACSIQRPCTAQAEADSQALITS